MAYVFEEFLEYHHAGELKSLHVECRVLFLLGLRLRKAMKLLIDQEADAVYLRLDDSKIVESEQVSPGVVLDFNDKGQVVGVEMLNISKRTPALDLKHIDLQTA